MCDFSENICPTCVHHPVCHAADDETSVCNNYLDCKKIIKRGQWMPCGFGKEIMCSVCRCELDDVWEYRHCPNCGAKMDLEVDA